MLKDFIKAHQLAFEQEAARLWDLIPKEFSDNAKSAVFLGPNGFEGWLLELCAGVSHQVGYSNRKDCQAALRVCDWRYLEDARYAFDCLAYAWRGEIEVDVKVDENLHGHFYNRGKYLTITFGIPD